MYRLRVAMIAPPWLAIPPKGYGGIEMVIYGLVQELKQLGVTVEIFANGKTSLPGIKVHSLYSTEQYEHIHKPFYESTPINISHISFALNAIARDGSFDIIHDHNGQIGPMALQWATRSLDMPPAIHTHHGPPFTTKKSPADIPDNLPMWRQLSDTQRLYIVGISESIMKGAPTELLSQVLPPVHNGIDPQDFEFNADKADYFITLARFSRDKGQHVAAEICSDMDYELKMAGTVAGITTPRQLILELANPQSLYRNYADFRYYSDKILPITVTNPKITYVGNVSNQAKQVLISRAKALLFPIDWEEPFGMAVIEAMACGTPVVAMNRGAMSEIINHGVNGFLAKDRTEFRRYMTLVNEIDPAQCRRAVEERFSVNAMALGYLERYKQALANENRPN